MKIKSTHPESQGDYVEIDDENFDPATMTEYVDGDEPVKRGRKPKE